MALTEQVIKKWSQQGDPIQAWYSYQTIRTSLFSSSLNELSYGVYPQGSYANKTNIADNSDIDMVICLTSAFYPDKSRLSPPELLTYAECYESASMTWHHFRKIVIDALRSDFFFVEEGKKAIKVSSGLIRLPADVLIALDHRYYERFFGLENQSYVDGVQFYTPNDHEIVNYPKLHVRACAEKDILTSGLYRKAVRVAKNARNALISDDEADKIGPRTAPSYFIESLMWNVPDECYDGSVQRAYRQAITWLQDHPKRLADMDFPNKMGKLFGRTPDTSWSQPHARDLIAAAFSQLEQ